MRWIIVVALVALLLAGGAFQPAPAYACSIEGLSLEQLIEQSEWIIEGTVSETFGGGYGAEVAVNLVYKGEAPAVVTVNPTEDPPRTFLDPVHGVMTEQNSCTDLQASFVQGEAVLLFLREDPVRGWTTLGMMQGKVSRAEDAVVGQSLDWPQRWEEIQAIVSDGVGQAPFAHPPAPTEEADRTIPLGVVLLGSAAVLAGVALGWERFR